MIAAIATDARTIVTATAETSASASAAYWGTGGQYVRIERRRLSSGLVRIRITAGKSYIPGAQQAYEVSEVRDAAAAEADALFVKVLKAYDARYLAALPTTCRPEAPRTWAVALAA